MCPPPPESPCYQPNRSLQVFTEHRLGCAASTIWFFSVTSFWGILITSVFHSNLRFQEHLINTEWEAFRGGRRDLRCLSCLLGGQSNMKPALRLQRGGQRGLEQPAGWRPSLGCSRPLSLLLLIRGTDKADSQVLLGFTDIGDPLPLLADYLCIVFSFGDYSGWEEIRPPRLVWNSGGEWLCLSGIDFGFIRITRSWLDVLVPFQKGSSDFSLETVHPVRGVCATREGTTHRQLRVSTWLQKGGSVESGQLRWFSGVGGRRASLLGGL